MPQIILIIAGVIVFTYLIALELDRKYNSNQTEKDIWNTK